MESVLIIRSADIHDISTIGYLAQQIWPQTYGGILAQEQLVYMLSMFYHPDSLVKQMTEDNHIFFIAELEEEPVGFISYGIIEEHSYKIHKCYVLPEFHGRGIGRALINVVIEQVQEAGGNTVLLNVNRENPAISFYKKLGFELVKEENIAIGYGFYMNDYVMKLKM